VKFLGKTKLFLTNKNLAKGGDGLARETNYQKPLLLYIISFALLTTFGFTQTERWVYRYYGTNSYHNDEAYSICYGADGNLYVAGVAYNDSTGDDFTVISLTNSGTERWIYKYNGLANYGDRAFTVDYGSGNIYIGGTSYGSDTIRHLTVISLTLNGNERWVYQFNSPTTIDGCANSVTYGADGNIYIVGVIRKINTGYDIIVISLTESGIERWVYTYTSPGNGSDYGYSIAYGADNNIYVTGYRTYYSEAIVAICLTNLGSERWVYQCDRWSTAKKIVYGLDSDLYIFGRTYYYVGGSVFSHGLLISLFNSGNERWRYETSSHPYEPSYFETGVDGADGNLYAVGAYGWDIPFFLIESVSDSGIFRWNYIDTTWGYATSIIYGNDGNIYAGGLTSDTWQGGESYFTVISFTHAGDLCWFYRKPGWWNLNIAHSVAYGPDGNIYAAGTTTDSITGNDFTVIGLSSTGIQEYNTAQDSGSKGLNLNVQPSIINTNAQIYCNISYNQTIRLSLYDIVGRKIETIAQGVFEPGVYTFNHDFSHLSSGIYFLILEGEKETKTEKVLMVR